MPKSHKGVFYWPTCAEAIAYARDHGLPTDRIISYEIGWAIQLRVSGPYVGPSPGPGHDLVCWEHQANREPVRLSFAIKVF